MSVLLTLIPIDTEVQQMRLIKKHILFSLLLITGLSVSIMGKYESNIYPIAGYSEDFGVIYGGYYFVDLPSGGKAGRTWY